MSVRNGLLLLGAFKQLQRIPSVNKAVIRSNLKQQIRLHGSEFYYRGEWKPQKNAYMADWLMGTFWWWFFWHLFTQYEELIGHDFPDPSKWTDEELGVPPI